MAQRVGVAAVVDLADFNRGLRLYLTGIDRMNISTSRMVQDLANDFNLLGKLTAGIGASIALGLTGGAARSLLAYTDFTTEAVRQSADLEQGIANVGAVLGLATEQLLPLKDVALELGINPQLKVDAFEAADSMLVLAKNGLQASQIMEGAAEASIALANATGGDFALAADVVTDILKIFNIEASEVERVIDQVTGVVNNSKFDLQDYFLSLSNSAAIFDSVGGSFEDLNTSIALISSAFNSGRRAGTGFSQFIIRLPGITDKAREHMLKLGIITQEAFENGQVVSEEFAAQLASLEGSYFSVLQQIRDYQAGVVGSMLSEQQRADVISNLEVQASSLEDQLQPLYDQLGQLSEQVDTTGNKFFDAEGNFIGMENAAQVLNEALGDLSDEARALAIKDIFGIDALEVVVRLMEEGAEGWQAFEQQVGSVRGFDIAATRMQTLLGSLEILEGQIEAILVLIGDRFRGGARRFIDTITDLLFINTDQIVSAWDPVGEAFDNLIDRIIPLVRQYFPDFIVLVERFNRVIALAIDWVGDMSVRYLPDLIDTAITFAEWLENIIVEGAVFNTTFEELPEIFKHVLRSFVEFINISRQIISWIRDFIGGVKDILEPLDNWLGRTITLTDIFLALGAAVAFAFLPIALLISKMITIATVTAAVISVIRDQYLDEFKGIFEFAKDVVYDFTQTFVSVFENLRRGDFGAAWEDILGFGKRTWDKIYAVIKRVVDRIQELIENIDWEEIWGRLLDTVVQFARDVINYIANDIDWAEVWKTVSEMAIEAFKSTVEWLKENIDWEGLWNRVVDLAQDAFNKVIDLVRGIDWLRIWNFIWDHLKAGAVFAWEWIRNYFNSIDWEAVWNRIRDGAIQAWRAFVNWFRGEFPETAQVIEDTWNKIKPILEVIKKTWSDLVVWFEANWPGIIETVKYVWAEVKPILDLIVQAVRGDFQGAWQGFKDWFEQEFPKTAKVLGKVWSLISPILTNLWNAVKDLTPLIVQAVQGDIQGAWQGFKDWFESEFPKTAAGLSVFYDELKTPIELIRQAVQGDLQGAWEGFKVWFEQEFPKTHEVLTRYYDAVLLFTESLELLFDGRFREAWLTARKAVATAMGQSTTDIDAELEKQEQSLFSGVGATIRSWFGSHFPESTKQTVESMGGIGAAFTSLTETILEKKPVLDSLAAFLLEEMTANVIAVLLAGESLALFFTGDWDAGWAKAKEATEAFWNTPARQGLSEWFGNTFPLAVATASVMIEDIEDKFQTLKENFKLLLSDIERDWEHWRQIIDLTLSLIITGVGLAVVLVLSALDELVLFLRGEASVPWVIWGGIAVLAITGIVTAIVGLAAISPTTWAIIAGSALIAIGLLWDEIWGLIENPLKALGDWLVQTFPRATLAFLEVLGLGIDGIELLIGVLIGAGGLLQWLDRWIGVLTVLDIALSVLFKNLVSGVKVLVGFGETVYRTLQIMQGFNTGDFLMAAEGIANIRGSFDMLSEGIVGMNPIVSAIQEITRAGLDSVSPFNNTWVQYASTVESNSAKINEKFESIKDQVKAVFGTGADSPESMVNAIGQGFEVSKETTRLGIDDILRMMTDWVGLNETKTSELTDNYSKLGGETMEAYKATFGDQLPTVFAMISDFIGETGAQLHPLTGQFESIGHDSVDSLAKAVSEKTGVAEETVKGLFAGTVSTSEVALGMSGGESGVYKALGSGMMGGLDTGISSNASHIFDTSNTFLNEMLQTYEGNLGTLANEGVNKFEKLKTESVPKVEGLKTESTGIVGSLVSDLSTKWEEIRARAVEKYNQMKVESLPEMEGLRTDSVDIVKDLSKQSGTEFTGMKDNTVVTFQGMSDENIETFSTFSEKSISLFIDFKSAISDIVVSLADRVKTVFGGMTISVLDSIDDFHTRAIWEFVDFSGSVTVVFYNIGEAIKMIFDDVFNYVVNKIQEIISTAETTFNADSFTTLGQNIVGGFISGIDSRIGEAQTKISELVALSQQAGETEAGAASDAKAFMPLGKNIIGGIIAGMNQRANDFSVAIQAPIQAAYSARAFSSAPISSPAPIGGNNVYSNREVNMGGFNVYNQLDEAELYYRVRKIVRQEMAS